MLNVEEFGSKWEECVFGQEFLYEGNICDYTVTISEMNFADPV